MGHAHHFLSRLDRVSLPHVELALTLYRDEDLLKYILGRARIADGADRVALSLDHPEEGPFLIVTRAGRFVTCLGAGMKASDLPVVTRGQLDGIAAKLGTLRERQEAANALAGGGGVRALLRRIYDAADDLSREDFIAISALQPLYAKRFARLYLEAAIDLEEAGLLLLPTLRKTERLKPVYKEALRAYWHTLWSVGHFAVLAAMDGAAPLPEKLFSSFAESRDYTLSWATTRQGILSLALRGAWAVARLGKPLLGMYKQCYHGAATYLHNVDGALGLCALGLRHSRLRTEVDKTLNAAAAATLGDDRQSRYVHAIRNAARTVNDIERRSPGPFRAMHQKLGAKVWFEVTQRLPPGTPFRFDRPEDVPEALALTAAVNLPATYLDGANHASDALMWLFMLLPWAARAAPEDLYFPRDALRAIRKPWTPDKTLTVLKALRDHEDRAYVPSEPEGPTRSGPCPCGSGKKYKRCCGVDAKGA
ncbi:MAG TPA: SEC-C metal-binding domain-containing protein [Candidatus Nanopelagicales bacterium]|nr:SEC-C metal-binding domain-containing protein [Candidatus Nanopelagicales bacterium]